VRNRLLGDDLGPILPCTEDLTRASDEVRLREGRSAIARRSDVSWSSAVKHLKSVSATGRLRLGDVDAELIFGPPKPQAAGVSEIRHAWAERYLDTWIHRKGQKILKAAGRQPGAVRRDC
jgi:hypothetical protein